MDYLFIGKGAAILLGFPGTTQDVDVFPAKDAEKRRAVTEGIFPVANIRDIIASKKATKRGNAGGISLQEGYLDYAGRAVTRHSVY